MAIVEVVRHARSAYPKDKLSYGGIMQAVLSRDTLGRYNLAVASTRTRAQQTARYLGYSNPRVDSRLNEYETEETLPTAHDYLRFVHSDKWEELVGFGDKLISALRQFGASGTDSLMVSHNAVMSACLRILEGTDAANPRFFDNLTGFSVEVSHNQIHDLQVRG